ncbi:Surface antigen msp4 [Ehrlichia minasensis]|nr:Surface antigen msp4 [Ehrlichia minasensis]
MCNIINYVIKYTIALAFLLLPRVSCAILIYNIEKNIKLLSLYISSQYKPSISQCSNSLIQEHYSKEKNTKISVLNSSTNSTIPYNIQLGNSTTNFSRTIGYPFKGLRSEVEGFYDIKNTNDSLRINLSKHFSKMYNEDFQDFITVRDNKLSIIFAIANTCYDILINNIRALSHLCIGVGVGAIEFFNGMSFKIVYQAKTGLSHLINSNVIPFFNVHYHKVIVNKFKNLPLQNSISINAFQGVISALANIDGYFGSEVGVRFIFN